MFVTTGKLSTDVKKPGTTLGAYLRATFPDLKALQDEYKVGAGPLLVEGNRKTAGTIGTALDLIVRLILNPDETPDSAILMYPFNTDFHDVVGELAQLAARSTDLEVQARAAYAMAECVSAYRAGPVWGVLMYERVRQGLFQTEEALQDASPESVDELIRLREIIQTRLIQRLEKPLQLGPEFDLTKRGPSQRLAGEADLIANGLLLDVKSNMGLKNKRGERPDALKPEHVFQLLGYALLDYSDAYKIETLGIYAARYGQLHTWPLEHVTSSTGGRTIDFAAARQTVWDLMQEEHEFI